MNRFVCCTPLFLVVPALLQAADLPKYSYSDVIAEVQPRIVKVYGSGGLQNLEAYQSGFLISADGFILTAWSYVLDTGEARVILDDGRRFVAKLVGADPRTEIAILKIDGDQLPFFDLNRAAKLSKGSRVLAFSNLYGVATGNEPASVQHGVVAGITKLSARRGSFETPYRGEVYVLDAMTNNAGAAGGALTSSGGELAGVLGKELRQIETNAWLNYAVPVASLQPVVRAILAGESLRDMPTEEQLPQESASLEKLGLVLLPNILRNTPPYVDAVLPNSPASKMDLRPDDLIVLINGEIVATQTAVATILSRVDELDPVRITIVRGSELLEFELELSITNQVTNP